MADRPATIAPMDLVETYEGLLIDAYGVLVHSAGAFPGAAEFIDLLNARDFPYRVVTNDASRLPETCAAKYRGDGVDVDAEAVITSGQMVVPFFESRGLQDARCRVLGTDDSKAYVQRAGATIVDPGDPDYEVLVLGDDAGFAFRPTVNRLLTQLLARFDAGCPPALVLPNPDRLFQRNDEEWGVAIGAIASMFESILADRYPDRRPTFERLGKPHAPIYREAMRQLDTDRVAMIGDQLTTDIAGANELGIDSVLMTERISEWDSASRASGIRPDYLLETLEMQALQTDRR